MMASVCEVCEAQGRIPTATLGINNIILYVTKLDFELSRHNLSKL